MNMVESGRSFHRSYYPESTREQPHFQHLDHHSAPSTPSPPYQYAPLSQRQQSTPVRSTPTSYPSPASYPSPSISAYHPPQQGGHGPNSPQYQHHSPPFSLPPMRITPPDPLPSPNVLPPTATSSLPHPSPIYYSPSHALPAPAISHTHSSPLHEALRYPLPQPPERIMSGGRHKKEIKRRTKTGCLTCRKRRIKCDEAHPTCKNCAKSKRECMGYDPIFKSTPGPAAIQPAPSSANSAPPPLTSASISYRISSPSGGIGYAPTGSTATNSPALSSCDLSEYPAPVTVIDPSLSLENYMGVVQSPFRATSHKRAFDRTTSPFPGSDHPKTSTIPLGRTNTPTPLSQRDPPAPNPAKRIKINDLLSEGVAPLTPPAGDQHSGSADNIRTVYRHRLAPILDNLTETNFFRTRGVQRIHRGGPFCEQLTTLLSRLRDRNGTYFEEEVPFLENMIGDAGVLLESLKLIYGTQASGGPLRRREDDYANESDVAQREETLRRIQVLEALVSGKQLPNGSASPTTSPKSNPQELVDQKVNFWKSLAKFVSLQEGRDKNQEFEATLGDMRQNQGSSRVREVLHAIAEARYYNFRLSEPKELPTSEERQKMKDFFDQATAVVVGTARSDGGTDPDCLIRRIAGRAVGLWATPITEAPLML